MPGAGCSLAVIGPGKVGTSIACLAAGRGWPVVAVGGRNRDKTEAAARLAGHQVKALSPAEAAKLADLVLVTVSDDAIVPVCNQLVEAGVFRKGAIVAHVSGALAAEVLIEAKSKALCLTASAHPLKTFATVESALADVNETYWFLEGDDRALDVLSELVHTMGGVACTISGGAKASYHAASVIACNYLTTLMDAAIALMVEAGVERQSAWTALRPLVDSTLNNIGTLGPAKALTGPIARGDSETIKRHVRAIAKNHPQLLDLYQEVGRNTILLALRKGSIDEEIAQRLRQELSESNGAC